MRTRRRLLAFAAAATAIGLSAMSGLTPAAGARSTASSCRLPATSGRGIAHVIYIVWDNTHLLRDNPNVPSDLEQMPHLLSFLRDNGTLLSNEHTPLIAHTADDIVTSETGLYPDRQGLSVANNYGYFNANGSISFPSDFTYWTDPVQTTGTPNPPYNLITPQGKNVPAPWVPYTRAGCNFGAIASGDIALENTNTTPDGDITRVFGTSSPYYAEAGKENAKGAPADLATANFEGLAIHCAKSSQLCGSGEADQLPDEPRGYHGYKGLFGALQVNPLLTGKPVSTSAGYMRSPALTDLNGKPILDGSGNAGFPGFDGMNPAVSLAFVASMQEHGVPVTYDYLTDAHDNQASGNSFGPGETGYVQQLRAYDSAFAAFFARLARDGITKRNTLFLFTADEGDHFVGAKPTNPGCDGVSVACNYDPAKIGEIDADLAPLLKAEQGNSTPFAVHNDSAPAFYIDGNPAPDSQLTRQLERDSANLTAWNPLIARKVSLMHYLAGSTELRLLHMVTGDPRRTPSFVMFADPNYYLDASSSSCPSGAVQPGCVAQFPGDAYNHGDVYPEINRTWLGLVGPGVSDLGETGAVWSDHADDRPTLMALLGLRDDYVPQGRVLSEVLAPGVASPDLRSPQALAMERVYKQLEAPVGQFGIETLVASTGALAAGGPGDATYGQCNAQLSSVGNQRDAIASRMQALLNGAEFGHTGIDPSQASSLTGAGEQVLKRAIATEEFCTPA
ncbi:MAG: hypothetical protein JO206_10045 [Solirubrobacterales bacterium]|nr:hypothetical protein [Solirubrobacterales bacterium]